jgi:hypothetical protein
MDFACVRGADYSVLKRRFGGEKGVGPQFESDFKKILEHEVAGDVVRVEEMVGNTGIYDQKVAGVLASASTWAYSDADTMARMMCMRGIPNNETVSMHVDNDGLFLDTTVHVVQSHCRDLVLVCFAGTRPTNYIQLFLDASAKTDSFFSMGTVHGGFYRGFLGLWPVLRVQLKAALLGYSNCFVNTTNVLSHVDYQTPDEIERAIAGQRPSDLVDDCPSGQVGQGMKALYLCGHSLGGAMAVLAAAAMHLDSELAPLADKLRGVYTFGQPMVGDEVFAQACSDRFGKQLFRHVYKRDLIPHFPPKTVGKKFVHFGSEYTAPQTNWELQSTQAAQLRYGALPLVLGFVAWLQDQYPEFGPLSFLRPRYSLADHQPINYLRTSLQSAPGSEFRP